MKKYYSLALLFVGLTIPGQAQRIVQGIVMAASDKGPLPGVTVLLKGTETGTSTDLHGKFLLAVPHDTATIRFSAVGYTPLVKKITAISDTTLLPPFLLKESCTIDFFYSKYLEFALLSGLRYAPFGGKVKVFYPYLFHFNNSQGPLRAEFSYQTGPHSYQRNVTLAIDNIFVDCAHDLSVTTDYQSVGISERGFSYARYTAGATYVGELASKTIPLYLAFGGLHYARSTEIATKAGVEVGATYPVPIGSAFRINPFLLSIMGRVAWWQSFWQYRAGVEAEFRRFTAGINFNKLGPYAEVNTTLGFRIQKRWQAKKAH